MLFSNSCILRLIALLLPLSLFSGFTIAADDKAAKFNNLSVSKGPKGVVQLNDNLYDELTKGQRDYTTVVLLTALDPRFGCAACRQFHPDYELIAKSSYGRQGINNLFFGILDFSAGRATFQKLQLVTAPVILVFPPNTGGNAKADTPLRYDFSAGTPINSEQIAAWMSRSTGLNVVIIRPFNWSKLGMTILSVLSVATFIRVSFPYVGPVLNNRNLWAAFSLIAVLLFTSGHMFNHIRKVPYVVNNGKGGVSYIAGGFSNQFGMETQIIAVLYAVLAFCTISLALKTPRIEDPKKQGIAIMVWNITLLCLFSFLLSVFKMKNGSYPFFLPPIMG